jgi:hypothetical protein
MNLKATTDFEVERYVIRHLLHTLYLLFLRLHVTVLVYTNITTAFDATNSGLKWAKL